ncbi:uncharacterized protein L969DRAFT_131868 [Mixia osmundae IAM 14324]|uniref:Uncharacterized protein n=1 Tax=Mixia osmundae (strain CBS 9802 / IAM 14324 / JCM 22182 / KY 12970) TaxID=764103 RepID=G7E004_MIXOS|nr:uncharacterized protein L969DRAFT_131868 [Mixia osmundae IAM 14324]KEI42155.1 hypothetical protein L969DRAFT_131868 [Mixia osmundae IAM 14324]GAA96164.1 hypothetical protein E5Q_02825 [Mixia osmundae IAM 14324]
MDAKSLPRLLPNAVLSHNDVELLVLLSKKAFSSGETISGILQLSASSEHIALGEIAVKLQGIEELDADVATLAFLEKTTLFQSASLPPSNAVYAAENIDGTSFWRARKGRCRFNFQYELPFDSPSSVNVPNLAGVTYVLTATVAIRSRDGTCSVLSRQIILSVTEQPEIAVQAHLPVIEDSILKLPSRGPRGDIALEGRLDSGVINVDAGQQIAVRVKCRASGAGRLGYTSVALRRHITRGKSATLGRATNPIDTSVITDTPLQISSEQDTSQVALLPIPKICSVQSAQLFEVQYDVAITMLIDASWGDVLQVVLPVLLVSGSNLPIDHSEASIANEQTLLSHSGSQFSGYGAAGLSPSLHRSLSTGSRNVSAEWLSPSYASTEEISPYVELLNRARSNSDPASTTSSDPYLTYEAPQLLSPRPAHASLRSPTWMDESPPVDYFDRMVRPAPTFDAWPSSADLFSIPANAAASLLLLQPDLKRSSSRRASSQSLYEIGASTDLYPIQEDVEVETIRSLIALDLASSARTGTLDKTLPGLPRSHKGSKPDIAIRPSAASIFLTGEAKDSDHTIEQTPFTAGASTSAWATATKDLAGVLTRISDTPSLRSQASTATLTPLSMPSTPVEPVIALAGAGLASLERRLSTSIGCRAEPLSKRETRMQPEAMSNLPTQQSRSIAPITAMTSDQIPCCSKTPTLPEVVAPPLDASTVKQATHDLHEVRELSAATDETTHGTRAPPHIVPASLGCQATEAAPKQYPMKSTKSVASQQDKLLVMAEHLSAPANVKTLTSLLKARAPDLSTSHTSDTLKRVKRPPVKSLISIWDSNM